MDDRSLARWRMHALRLVGPPHPSPTAVVEALLAVQAENHAQASWALACRSTGGASSADSTGDVGSAQAEGTASSAGVAAAFDRGEFLRTHVLRSTWHFVRPADIRWLVEVTAPRVRRTYRQAQESLGLDLATVTAAVDLVVDTLADGRHRTREALGRRLGAAGLPSRGRALGIVMASAELDALICSGALEDGDHTYALLEQRAPDARRLDREEAVAELVLRYFTGHGPATERDLSYWATMTLTDIRRGLADVGDRLQRLDAGGRTYWFAEPPPAAASTPTEPPTAHLLQLLDEYHNGYQDSRYILDAAGLRPPGRQASVGMVLLDGQLAGGMRRTVGADRVRFDVAPMRDLDGDERAAIEATSQAYGRFLGRDPEVRYA